jgi:hypothetical protein
MESGNTARKRLRSLRVDNSLDEWKVVFKEIDLRQLNASAVEGRTLKGESQVRLITRSGFEQ